MSHTDQPSSGDVSQGVEPSCPVEREAGNQSKIGVGALELYRPENQISESAPDTSHKPHLKSGKSNCGEFNLWEERGESIIPLPPLFSTLKSLVTIIIFLSHHLGWAQVRWNVRVLNPPY